MSNSLTLTGIIQSIGQTEDIGDKGFKKRSFLLKENKESYPSTWMIETHKDFTTSLDSFGIGDTVSCEVEVTGREWKDKAFNTLKAWKITGLAKAEKLPF